MKKQGMDLNIHGGATLKLLYDLYNPALVKWRRDRTRKRRKLTCCGAGELRQAMTSATGTAALEAWRSYRVRRLELCWRTGGDGCGAL
ncbi:unnamed protein product [Linum trigynum]|uniref:Uncharacterized protein n=1 Tax=Linum trigynum TaxID=586398 RepID=A0AAV2CLZ7_9ROSI